MKKRIYTAAGLFLAAALVLGGCGKEKVPESEFATADEAKEALTSAETIEIYFDLYGSKRKTKIVADGKVAGYLQKNTVYINEEEWFSIDYVEDEPINDREGSGTTYGYYDASGTCLGYAQEQYVDTSYGKDTRLIFLDVDETPLDYQSSRSGRILYDENDEEIGSAHRNADLHIHDLSMLTGYCAGWSLKQLIQEGLGGVTGKITSAPAKHLATLCNQMVNFLGIMQNEWAGAQAFSSFDTYLAPFVRMDKLSYNEVKHCVESFVYGVNTPSRWGTQAPFSNITLDWTVPADLAGQPCIVGGKPMSFTYGDCQPEMDMINKAFIEVMIEGDANGRGFQYPIPTYSITKDFDWSETENNRLLFEMTAKYGTPYFSNYINSDMEPSDVRSMCCRLRLDLRELRKKSGGFFGSGESTGSVGVVTINLPRIAYLAKDEADFFARLDHMMDIAARSLKIKRTTIGRLMEEGLYPYTKRYLGSFDNHFSTIGLVGMNEAGLNANWLRKDLTHEETQDFAVRVLKHMRERLSDYQEQYGDLYNLEATPAESTAYRLAKHDKAQYPNIITAHEGGTPYYTNSSHLPVGYTEDVFAALDVQDKLQTLYTSGTVFHTFLGEKLPDWRAAAALVRKIAENYELPYYTLSPTYSVCADHGYLAGEQFTCPICGRKTEVYSRITGYYRPVQNWNDGKSQEFLDRKTYQVGGAQEDCPKRREDKAAGKPAGGYYLYTTATCPNCHIIKPILEKAGIPFVERDAEQYLQEATALGLTHAPSLVVQADPPIIYAGVARIKEFLEQA